MKKLLSMLLCAVMTVTCIGAVPAHAASSDTRLRVGLTISGASTFAAPQLENVSGYRTGYTVGTVSGTAFSGSKSITSSALTVKLVNDAFQVSDTDSGSVLYTSAAGPYRHPSKQHADVVQGLQVVRRFCVPPCIERQHHCYKLCGCGGLCEGCSAVRDRPGLACRSTEGAGSLHALVRARRAQAYRQRL